MKSPLLYLLEVLFCSGLLMVFYRLLLMRKVSFALCRRYLVAAVVLSAVIPALNIPLYPAHTVVYPLPLITPMPVEAPAGEVFADEFHAVLPVSGSADMSATDWNALVQKTIWGIYALTAVVLLALVVVRIVSVRRLRRRSTLTDCGSYTLAEHPDVASPFSFLRTVFLGDGFEGRCREIVLHHEASHVVHRHSAERIVVETVRCLFWFNPFVWMAARWLQEVQEWEADHDVLEAGYDLTEYRIIIFHQLFGYNPDIACGLNHSLTKNRFAMMTHFKESRFALVRLGAAIPIVAGMMMLCSFTTRTPDPNPAPSAASSLADSLSLTGTYEKQNQYAGSFEKKNQYTATYEKNNRFTATYEATKRPDLFGAVVNGTISSEGWTSSDVYTMIGRLDVVFKGLPELKISCDTMICYPERVECRGDASMKDGKGNTFFGQCFEFSRNAAGELEWRVRKFQAVSETATIHISADKIVFNGKPITKEQLSSKIGEWHEPIPTEKRVDAVITLKADQQTKMGAVTDVKEVLRKAGQLRVNYVADDAPEAVVRMLPPPADVETINGVRVVPARDVAIKERNLFTVSVNGSGKILAGPRGKEQIISADKLAAMVETFVANASDNRNLPEKETREFILPNGRTVTYPVSEGVVSLMIARDTPYPVFVDIQRRISAGFNEIRGTVAQKWFGKNYSSLDETQRQLVVRAVPLNIAEAEPHD